MRAAVRRSDTRFRALVALLHEDGSPAAQTWRLVAAAAEAKGLLRPSYAHVRRLVQLERRRRRRRAELREAVQEAAHTLLAGRVPNVDYTIGRIRDARRRLVSIEACVSETQGVDEARAASTRGP